MGLQQHGWPQPDLPSFGSSDWCREGREPAVLPHLKVKQPTAPKGSGPARERGAALSTALQPLFLQPQRPGTKLCFCRRCLRGTIPPFFPHQQLLSDKGAHGQGTSWIWLGVAQASLLTFRTNRLYFHSQDPYRHGERFPISPALIRTPQWVSGPRTRLRSLCRLWSRF